MGVPCDEILGNHSKGLPGCFYTLWAGSSPSLPDGSNPSAAIVQSASDVQCSRLLKTTAAPSRQNRVVFRIRRHMPAKV
ncbi:hypothetical protein DY930_36130, partial [Pseudomonas aeruginosa]